MDLLLSLMLQDSFGMHADLQDPQEAEHKPIYCFTHVIYCATSQFIVIPLMLYTVKSLLPRAQARLQEKV